MERRPFASPTFLFARENAKQRDFSFRAMTAVASALAAARMAGNAEQFDRLAVQYVNYRSEVLALDTDAVLPEVSLEFGAAPVSA